MKKHIEDRYLGDGVYASFDGWHIWLDTRAQIPVNRIALEQSVLQALDEFRRDVAEPKCRHGVLLDHSCDWCEAEKGGAP